MRRLIDRISARINRIGLDAQTLTAGFYGSKFAARFIAAAIAGSDSVDFVTIGDSNCLRNYAGVGGCGGGFTRGLWRAMIANGALCYGSAMRPVLHADTASFVVGLYAEDGTNGTPSATGAMDGFAFRFLIAGSPPAGCTGVVQSGKTSGNFSNIAPVSTSITDNGGTHTYALSPWECGAKWDSNIGFDYAFVPLGSSFNCFSKIISTYPETDGASPTLALPEWCAVGVQLNHCLVYGKTVGTTPFTGNVNPIVYKSDSTTVVASQTNNTNNATAQGGQYINQVDLPFTMPSTNGGTIHAGWSYQSATVGKANILYHSIYRVRLGFSVHNLHAKGGQSSTVIRKIITGGGSGGNDVVIGNFLGQIQTRQAAPGGSGKIVVVIECGVNNSRTGDTPSVITDDMEAMVGEIALAWTDQWGGDMNDIAFVCMVTPPVAADYTDTLKEAQLIAYRSALNTWATSGFAVSNNVMVLDQSAFYTAAQRTANGYYDYGTDNYKSAHRSQAGYFADMKKFIDGCATFAAS